MTNERLTQDHTSHESKIMQRDTTLQGVLSHFPTLSLSLSLSGVSLCLENLQFESIILRSNRTTRFNPLTPTVAIWVYSYKASCARTGQAVICNFWHPGTLTLSYPYGNSGSQRANSVTTLVNTLSACCELQKRHLVDFWRLKIPMPILHRCENINDSRLDKKDSARWLKPESIK